MKMALRRRRISARSTCSRSPRADITAIVRLLEFQITSSSRGFFSDAIHGMRRHVSGEHISGRPDVAQQGLARPAFELPTCVAPMKDEWPHLGVERAQTQSD